MKSDTKAYIYAACSVLSWSTVAVAFKTGLRLTTVSALVFYGVVTAFVLYAVALFVTGRYRELRKLRGRDLRAALLLGLINPFLYYTLLFGGYDRLPAHIAQPLNYIWPILLTLFIALRRRQPVPKTKYIGLLISLAGAVAVSMESVKSDTMSVLGFVCVVGSAVVWAFYWTMTVSEHTDSLVRLFVGFGVAVIPCAIAYFVTASPAPTVQSLGAGVYVGTFEMCIPFLLWNRALRLTSKQYAVNQLSYFVPFLSLIPITILLHEHIAPVAIFGLILIIGGVMFNRYTRG